MFEIPWHGEVLQPRADRSLYWPRAHTLLIADPHFGKDASFRRRGVPVPATAAATIERLDRALRETAARRLVVLGDFWHAAEGVTDAILAALRALRARHADVDFELVRGNHDRSAGDPPGALRIDCSGERRIAPFRLLHEPPIDVGERCAVLPSSQAVSPAVDRAAALCGHVHPCAAFSDAGGGTRFPCFVFDDSLAILPAFGDFTGMHCIRPARGRRILMIVEQSVIELRGRVKTG